MGFLLRLELQAVKIVHIRYLFFMNLMGAVEFW